MRCLAVSLLAIAVASSVSAQSQADSSPAQSLANPRPVSTGATTANDNSSRFQETFGSDDVVAVAVYDAPELSRSVRVDAAGDIRLPIVRQHIHAAGLDADELENAVAAALVDEHIMVSPIVTVTLVEAHSKPISVTGAVRNPITFQITGTTTLLEAIVRAGGLAENAGAEVEVSHLVSSPDGTPVFLKERIQLRPLMDSSYSASNITLRGGESVRVLPVGLIFIVGNVKRPGPLQITDESESTVLKAVTLSGGLDSFSSKTAYIYRVEAGAGQNKPIPVQVKKIMTFKAPDVQLYGNDMLYVPNATGQRLSSKAFGFILGAGFGIAGLLIYLLQ